MASGRLRRMMNMSFPKRKLNQNSNPNESENPSHYGFICKNCQNPTIVKVSFGCELRHISILTLSTFLRCQIFKVVSKKSRSTKVKHIHHLRRHNDYSSKPNKHRNIRQDPQFRVRQSCENVQTDSSQECSANVGKNSGKVKMAALTTRSSLWYTKYVPKSIFWNNWTEQQQTTQTCTTTALASCSKQYVHLTQPSMIAAAISLQAKFPSWRQQTATFCSQ